MKRIIILVSIYAVAMAFLESAVVVYLRELYYPGGFEFPLTMIEGHVALTEIIREFFTLVMLFTIALLASVKRDEIVAWFIYAFAIWDIFYYIFLKLILGWPSSLLTWDILFLIPTTWTGPVLAPLINSVTMILLALVIIHFARKGHRVSLNRTEWALIIAGSLITIISYIQDYITFMLNRFTLADIFLAPNNEDLMHYASGYIPEQFNWVLFSLGEFLFLLTIFLFTRRLQRAHS